jgi:hypothetical protein
VWQIVVSVYMYHTHVSHTAPIAIHRVDQAQR